MPRVSWLRNGQSGGLIRPDDRGFAYGDGLFETIAWRSGMPRFLDRHLLRLAQGCSRLGLPFPGDATLDREIALLAAGHLHGTVRLTLTRGPGPRGYAPPDESEPTRVVSFHPGPVRQPSPAGLSLALCQTPASNNTALAGMKTLNRLDNVLARVELAGTGFDEGVMCDGSGHVIGATAANVFAARAGVLLTPDLSQGGVAGIMRNLVLECAGTHGIAVRELRMTIDDLLEAEELFLTNALTGLRAVTMFDGRQLPGGELTRAIAAALRDCGVREDCA